jgi:ketosteroid isomerase-like protein
MDENNKDFIIRFYSAFQTLNYAEMQRSYHREAQFSDPVFGTLNSDEVKAMWEMLLSRGKDLRVEYSNVHATQTTGSCRWEAWYTFSKTGRSVHNVIASSFEFRDGKIFRHRDSFSLWRWSRQALGPAGLLLGWSPLMRGKVKRSAKESLDKYRSR